MKKSEFNKSASITQEKFRAVCKDHHPVLILGVWHDQYAEAVADGERHRLAPGNKNRFHNIWIEEKVNREAKLDEE